MEKIVVVGSLNMDVIIGVKHIPIAGETVMANGVNSAHGGKGANQALSVAKLGGDVHMIGCLGDDAHGNEILLALRQAGVNVSGISLVKNQPTGTAYINVSDNGSNNIVVNSGANSSVTIEVLEAQKHIFTGATYCITQMEIPFETVCYLVQLCKEKGIKLIFNPAPARKLDFQTFEGVYMIAPNESEMDLLIEGSLSVEEKAQALYEKGFENVLVTLGEVGCLLINEKGKTYYDAFKKLDVVDTTAAGDSFIGTMAYGLSTGNTLEESIRMAAVAAAITVSGQGAQPSLPDITQVMSCINNG